MTQDYVVKVPDDIPIDKLSLVGCAVITGVGAAVKRAKVEPGSRVAIWGSGGVGLNVVQGCVIAGASRIIAVDLADNKLEFARQFGATDTVNASEEDPIAKVIELTGGGADYTFEAIGEREDHAAGVRCRYRPGGTCVTMGAPPEGGLGGHPDAAVVPGPHADGVQRRLGKSPRRLPVAYRALPQRQPEAGRVGLTVRRPLDEVNDAFDDMAAGRVARTVLIP